MPVLCPIVPRCRALTFAGKPGQMVVRCKLPAGHPEPNHIPDLEEKLGD